MLGRLVYKSGVDPNRVIDLDCIDISTQSAPDLRGHKWSYDLKTKQIASQRRKPREVSLDTLVTSPEMYANLLACADQDMQAGEAGALVVDDTWVQHAFIVSVDINSVHMTSLEVSIKLLLIDGVWVRERTKEFSTWKVPDSEIPTYPQGYPYDYATDGSAGRIYNESPIAAHVKVVFWGYARNPYITIADNRYEVRADINTGQRVELDTRDKTCIRIGANGERENIFSLATRQDGSYAFKRVPAGSFPVLWNNQFSFDIHIYEEVSEPPWTL